MDNIASLIIATALADNIILTAMLGLCPFVSLSKQLSTATGIGLATTFVLTLSCALAWWVDRLLPNELRALLPLLLIFIVACIVQLAEVIMRWRYPKAHRVLGIFLPLITTNCAVLGSILLVLGAPSHSFWSATLSGAGYGLGFWFALLCLFAVRQRMVESAIPRYLRGSPILMVNAGVMAMVFSAFA